MGRILSVALLLTWMILSWSCGGHGSPNGPGGPDGNGGQPASDTLFADRGLEAAVRVALGRPEGSISQKELSSLKSLDAHGLGIKDLGGIGQLDSLQSLNLADNEVTSLSPLATLVQVEYLDFSHNQVTDITALMFLVQLKVLILEQNAVQDLSPLEGLSHLERLELTEGMITTSVTAGLAARGVEVVWAMAGELPSSGGVDTGTPVAAGPRIAFSVVKAVMNGDADIWVMAPDGSDRVPLISSADSETQPAWSPDGTQLAFCRGPDGFRHIYVLRTGSKEPARLTQDRGDEHSPAWSPDGSRIAYVRGYEILVTADDGSGSENLTQHPAMDFDPSWSPNGKRITFSSTRDAEGAGSQCNIFVMDADGSNIVNLTRHPSRNVGSCFSPDGTRIAFYSDRERTGSIVGTYDIYLMGADGSDQLSLTGTLADGVYDMHPRASWSPDGRQIVYDYQGGIWKMAPDGSDQTMLLASAFGLGNPVWVADAAMDLAGLEEEPPRLFADANLEKAVLAQLVGVTREEATEADLSMVTSVTCQDCGIRDLTGIQKLRSLRQLNLTNGLKDSTAVPDQTWNQVNDLSALGELPELKELALALGPEADLSPLAQLGKLTRLTLAGDGTEDLSSLAHLMELKELSLTSNRLQDLGPLSGLMSLTRLYLTGSQISDLLPLASLSRLAKLAVTNGPVRNLSPLSGLNYLNDLSLYKSQVEDLAPLSRMPSLIYLSVKYSQIREVSPLLGLPMLRHAFLAGNPLSQRALDTDIPALRERGVVVSY